MSLHLEPDPGNRIHEAAKHLFLKHGYSRVSMDDIATSVGMSKKTLYKHYSSKLDLLFSVIQQQEESYEAFLDNILQDKQIPFLEKLKKLVQSQTEENNLMFSLQLDLSKSAPDIYNTIQENKKKNLPKLIKKILDQGIKEKQIKKTANADIISQMFIGTFNTVFNPEYYQSQSKSLTELIDEVVNIIFFGILIRDKQKN
ncbi:MAG: TetR/AcrR family transcriptional regulator [Leptospiraceae bacterium]|nr:TetR/AcrR family transcriptional regulator [Leptospiraceae bacterium]MCP5500700.1 TetR/AcrR family transcriptional regulator [Leptospiraceae bacterium]